MRPATAGGFEHDVLVYDDEASLLGTLVPFVTDGLDSGEPVMVAVGPEPAGALRSALGGDAGAVRFIDMHALGRNPARIIPAWSAFVAEAGGAPVRGIGEPVWPGRSETEIIECEHHEALLDLAFTGGPAWRLLCPYDARGLPGDVVERARTHHRDPAIPDRPLTDEGANALAPPPREATTFDFGIDLAAVRDAVRSWAAAAGLTGARTEDLVLSVDELAANSIRHGGGRGRLRLWADGDRVVADVADDGVIRDPLVGRRQPPVDFVGGRGLWIANLLCDLVQIRSSASGTVVRAHLARA
jgi:anti-sigma regulatory factor (Ser/Thr protein kinase)